MTHNLSKTTKTTTLSVFLRRVNHYHCYVPPPPPPPPPAVLLLIQLMKLLMRAYTEYLLVRHCLLVTHEAAPRRTQRPPSWQTRGPPLSPLQALLPRAPAHTIDDSCTKLPLVRVQVECATTGTWDCCK